MPGELHVASFIVRVTFRNGRRRIQLIELKSGARAEFDDYGDLREHLSASETRQRPGKERRQ